MDWEVGRTPVELQFKAENQLIEVTPLRNSSLVYNGYSGKFGPFARGKSTKLPLFLALLLKSRGVLAVRCPAWLQLDALKHVLREEQDENRKHELAPLPEYWEEMAALILKKAPEDVAAISDVRQVLQSIREVRRAKILRGRATLLGLAEAEPLPFSAGIPHVGRRELLLLQDDFLGVLDDLQSVHQTKLELELREARERAEEAQASRSGGGLRARGSAGASSSSSSVPRGGQSTDPASGSGGRASGVAGTGFGTPDPVAYRGTGSSTGAGDPAVPSGPGSAAFGLRTGEATPAPRLGPGLGRATDPRPLASASIGGAGSGSGPAPGGSVLTTNMSAVTQARAHRTAQDLRARFHRARASASTGTAASGASSGAVQLEEEGGQGSSSSPSSSSSAAAADEAKGTAALMEGTGDPRVGQKRPNEGDLAEDVGERAGDWGGEQEPLQPSGDAAGSEEGQGAMEES